MNKNKDPNWITENGNENQGEKQGKKAKGGGGEGGGGGSGGEGKSNQQPKDNKPKAPAVPVSIATRICSISRLQGLVRGRHLRFLQHEVWCWLCICLLFALIIIKSG